MKRRRTEPGLGPYSAANQLPDRVPVRTLLNRGFVSEEREIGIICLTQASKNLFYSLIFAYRISGGVFLFLPGMVSFTIKEWLVEFS